MIYMIHNMKNVIKNIFSKALDIIDQLHELERYTTDSLKVSCKMKLLEGKIFQEILTSEENARKCYK